MNLKAATAAMTLEDWADYVIQVVRPGLQMQKNEVDLERVLHSLRPHVVNDSLNMPSPSPFEGLMVIIMSLHLFI